MAKVQYFVTKRTKDSLADSSHDCITHSLNTSRSRQMYGNVCDEVVSPSLAKRAFLESEHDNKRCFVGMIEAHTYKTVTTLK